MALPRRLSLALIAAIGALLVIDRAIANGENGLAPYVERSLLQASVAESDMTSLAGWQIIKPVEVVSIVTTKTARVGDVVQARLCDDIRFGARLIACKGALLKGHVMDFRAPRRMASAIVSSERRLKSRAMLTIQFDEMQDRGACLYIIGKPCKQKNVSQDNGSKARLLEVDAAGNIVASEGVLTGGLKAAAISARVATSVPVPGNLVVSTLAAPAFMGAVGAASPSVAANRPVDASENGARAHAMAYGFLSNLPGAFLVLKGSEVELAPGDQMMLDICFKHPCEAQSGPVTQ